MTIRTIALAAAAVLAPAVASAADLPRKSIAPVMVAAPVASWTGFYVGVGAGALMSDNKWETTGIAVNPAGVIGPAGFNDNPSSLNATSFQLTGFAGFNYQFSPTLVAGLEADIGGAFGGKKSIYGIPGTFIGAYPANSLDSTRSELGLNGSIRGRLGYLLTPSVMLYGTGGVALQEVKDTIDCNGVAPGWCIANRNESRSTTRVGWTLGAGLEAMFTSNILGRIEYRYADFGTRDHTFFAGTADAVAAKNSLKTHTVQVGIAYKF